MQRTVATVTATLALLWLAPTTKTTVNAFPVSTAPTSTTRVSRGVSTVVAAAVTNDDQHNNEDKDDHFFFLENDKALLESKNKLEPKPYFFGDVSNTAMPAAAAMELDVDYEALEHKNKSRQKFGLKPMTPQEFVEHQMAVQLQVQDQQRQRQEQQERAEAASQSLQQSQQSSSKMDFLDTIFGMNKASPKPRQMGCESNYDCEDPQVCCDYGYQKVCCSNGPKQPKSRFGELALVRVPI